MSSTSLKSSVSARRSRRTLTWSALGLAVLLPGVLLPGMVACGPSSGSQASTVGTGVVDGVPVVVQVDPNQGGAAESLVVEEIRWGRLVDIYDAEDDDSNPQTPPIRNLILREYLISENIISNGSEFSLDTSPFTEQTELTIFADSDSDDLVAGSSKTQKERFEELLEQTTLNLGFVPPTGLGSAFSPPFPLIPRNAAVSIRMNDLLDHTTITEETVRVFTGNPQTTPFGARIFPDPNYGAFVVNNGVQAFHSTRILIDFTVSEAEALTASNVSVNSIGLPSSSNKLLTNALVRIPTRTEPSIGQFRVVQNLIGKSLGFDNNGPNESTITSDVIRTFRTGQSSDGGEIDGDNNNGFLLDVDSPRILGSQAVSMDGVPILTAPSSQEGDSPSDVIFLLNYDFLVSNCAQTAMPGDILRMRGSTFSDLFVVVTRQAAPPQAGQATDVRVRLLPIPAGETLTALRDDFLLSTSGEFLSIFSPGPGVQANCFFQISPAPGLPPVDLISTTPQITVRFSEPMNPATVSAHETFRLDRVEIGDPGPTPTESIVAQISGSPDLREYRYSPITPIDHVEGDSVSSSDELFLTVLGGANGIVDLAGNPLADSLPSDIRLTVNPSAQTVRTGGIVLTFESIDEDGNSPNTVSGMLFPEVRGQFTRDVEEGILLPRQVDRDSRVADRNNALVALMTTTGAPIITPLVPLGSRMMTVWRYADVGFAVLDEATSNIDVEGLSYAPFNGNVSSDFFDLFEISLAHSAFLPDEFPIPATTGGGGYAMFQNSGLNSTFAVNVLKDPKNQQTIVHDRGEGYFLSPSQVFTASTGTLMMPYPMNRNGETVSDFDYYTWRDTAILATGGEKSFGADLKALVTTGDCATNIPTVYSNSAVRSLGLPLLMEFKCFQDIQAGGFNGLDTSFALPTQRFPIFRVFSSGGFMPDGGSVAVNPDSEAVANGGLNGTTGKSTNANDNTFMIGQMDTVIRVSRMHTIWFDTLDQVGVGSPTFSDPLVEPKASDQPSGTSLVLAFRGATQIFTASPSTGLAILVNPPISQDVGNALMYDAYGDQQESRIFLDPDDILNCPTSGTLTKVFADFRPQFFDGDKTWHSNIRDLDGARFIQARVTFISNTATGFRPELSTLAIPFTL